MTSYSETPEADCLIHCAETNDRTLVNIGGSLIETETLRSLHAVLAKKYDHIIYMSSAVLYGDQQIVPHTVFDPVKVVDGYTRIKYESEKAVLAKGGAVIRLSNLYGPGMAAANVFSHIIRQLGNGGVITMQSLSPVRDFLWVNDAAFAVCAALKKTAKGVYNVGSGRGTSIRELVDIFKAATRSNQDVIELQNAQCSSQLVLDIAATQQLLNWTPLTSLEDGVRHLINT